MPPSIQDKTTIDSVGNSPATWIRSCRRLLNGAELVECGTQVHKQRDKMHCDGALAAMMLVGFAFENALKAEYLARGKILYCDGRQIELKGHSFAKWAALLELELSDWESDSLRKAEYICTGPGRYPFHNNIEIEKERLLTLSLEDVAQVKRIVGRLLDSAQGVERLARQGIEGQ